MQSTAIPTTAADRLGLLERVLLVVACTLSLATGLLLYILPGGTSAYFAWTIKNPMTAAFLGASYLAGTGTFWALRAGTWRAMRPMMPFMLTFATLHLLATVLNWGTFNFAHVAAWGWVVVYVVSVPLAWGIFVHHLRDETKEPRRRLSGTLRPLLVVLLALATLHMLVGLALVALPNLMATVWPWGLTPLTSQAIGSWYLAGGISVWARLLDPRPADGQTGQLAGFVTAPLLLIAAAFLWKAFTGPRLAVGLYLADVALAGVLLVYARLSA